jgi:hypothetical protein
VIGAQTTAILRKFKSDPEKLQFAPHSFRIRRYISRSWSWSYPYTYAMSEHPVFRNYDLRFEASK